MTTPTKSKVDPQIDLTPGTAPKLPRMAAARPAAHNAPTEYMLIGTSINPQHVMLKIPDLMNRYGCGNTTACALVNDPDFPGEVALRAWRLDHVMEFEEARAWAGRVRPAHPRDAIADNGCIDGAAPRTHSNKEAA